VPQFLRQDEVFAFIMALIAQLHARQTGLDGPFAYAFITVKRLGQYQV
jgi:hypothetical protein